uniref:Uncharacterized protein n=1 Tax=Anguilla anguilla TaxID=7936 RepID=A0A0E9WVJ6_ANGAN
MPTVYRFRISRNLLVDFLAECAVVCKMLTDLHFIYYFLSLEGALLSQMTEMKLSQNFVNTCK